MSVIQIKSHWMLILIAGLILLSSVSAMAQEKTTEGETMTEEKTYTEEQAHKQFAVQFFNGIWDLLGKENRTAEEDQQMINAAHASCYHWSFIGDALNQQRGQWMISHVYAVLGRAEPALHHARICLALTEENGYQGFDLAYAYEAMARAYNLNKNQAEYEKYYQLAKEAGEKIEGEEDQKLFLSDLEAGSWVLSGN